MSDSLKSLLAVDRLEVDLHPFPHVLVDEFFRPDAFRELLDQFPQITEMKSDMKRGETGWGQTLYWGDEEYDRHLEESPGWKRVFDLVHSQSFLDYIIDELGELFAREGCVVDLSKARYVPYCEDRVDKQLNQLRKVEHEPHELWCRLDFYQGYRGYYRPVHLDHQRRLISMLVYFSDQDVVARDGGDLILHSPGPDLWMLGKLGLYQTPKLFSLARDRLAQTLAIKPRGNRMALFPCGKRSWHAVPAVRSASSPRQHIQITISSSTDIWP